MAQLLANELLIQIFDKLLNETSFKYMNSIRTVSKKWNTLIKLVLIEEIEYRFKNEINIKYDSITHNIIPIYNPSDSTFDFHFNGIILLSYVYNACPTSNVKQNICFEFEYEYNDQEVVEFNLGSLSFSTEKDSDIKYKFEWNYEDCLCICTGDTEHNPDSLVIKFENLFLPLKRMCVILDILDENEESEYPHIERKLIEFDSDDSDDYYTYDYDYTYDYTYTYNYTYNYDYTYDYDYTYNF